MYIFLSLNNYSQFNLLIFYVSRYDSITDSSRNDMKRKFALTMEFVEEYLKEVVNQPFPFGDKEKNKLTFEVFFKNNSFTRLFSFSYQITEHRRFFFL